VVQRAFVMAEDEQITDEWLPSNPLSGISVVALCNGEPALAIKVGTSMAEMERQLIFATLHHYKQHKEQAAVMLGISMKTLQNRLREYAAGSSPQDEISMDTNGSC
jgi:DNA-binding NtrC family response regulator